MGSWAGLGLGTPVWRTPRKVAAFPFWERTLYHRCTEQSSGPRSCSPPGLQIPASVFGESGGSRRPSPRTQASALSFLFLRTHGGSAFPPVLSRGSPPPLPGRPAVRAGCRAGRGPGGER